MMCYSIITHQKFGEHGERFFVATLYFDVDFTKMHRKFSKFPCTVQSFSHNLETLRYGKRQKVANMK